MKEIDPMLRRPPSNRRRNPLDWMRWVPLALLVLVVAMGLIIGGQIILVPLLASLTLAYLLGPLVSWFERRGWSRPAAVLLTMTGVTLALVLALVFIVPSFWYQVSTSYTHAKDLIQNYQRADPLLNKIRRANPQLYKLIITQMERLKTPLEQERLWAMVTGWFQSGLFQLVNFTTSILDLLLIPFFVFYLLADYRAMRDRLERVIPPRYRSLGSDLFNQINTVLSSYVRSQLIIALGMGALYSVGFLVLRVPMAITIGMLSGLLNFVPYLGTLTGIVLAVAFAALDGAGFSRLLGVLSVFAIVQSIEGYYLTPKLLGSRLNMHPLLVLVGLMIGGNLFGLLGIILAVPVIAIGKVVIGFLERIYQESEFYRATGVNLLTGQGQLADFSVPSQSSGLIVEVPEFDNRRSVVTTGELKSRILEDTPAADN